MTPKHISAADCTPVRVVIITLDNHLSSAAERAAGKLRRELPGLALSLHAAAEWGENESKLENCRQDIARAAEGEAVLREIQMQIDDKLLWIQFNIHPREFNESIPNTAYTFVCRRRHATVIPWWPHRIPSMARNEEAWRKTARGDATL